MSDKTAPKKRIIKRVDPNKIKPRQAAKPEASPTEGPKVYSANTKRASFVDSNLNNFFSALALFSGSFILFVMVLFWTPDQYHIPATDDYRLIALKSLADRGDISDDDARDFTAAAIAETLSVSHLRPKTNMSTAMNTYFTASGRDEFVTALKKNGDLDPLLSGRYATLATIQSVPVIDGYRRTNGKFTWVYHVPVEWRWNDVSTGGTRFANLIFTVFVVRESQLVKSAGMAVDAVIIGSES